MTKPDFIIIGAMKCATSTLHTQLSMQPGIFMSDPKEPNFFSDDENYAQGLDWYKSIFAPADVTALCGESSTHYSKLPNYPFTVQRMAEYNDRFKLIYVMRHPVERLVSHYIHEWTQNVYKCDINEAIDRYEELTAYSCYAMQLKPFIEKFGSEAILPVFNEAIRHDPQQQLEHIAGFIGYKNNMVWREDCARENVSSERIRKFAGYDLLVNSSLMTSFRRNLIPQGIRDQIKRRYSMQQRPEINAEHSQRLYKKFDQQLAQIGEWLGIDLNCDNYHSAVIQQNYQFKKI